MLYTIAFGGIIVPKINLIQDLICRDYYSRKALAQTPAIVFGQQLGGVCEDDAVVRATSFFNGAANLIGGLLSAITSPKLGALSDRYGRKPLICATALGSLVTEVLTICAASYPNTFHVYWLYLGYGIDGLCGTFIVGMALANSYAADCTPPEKRSTAFSLLYGCLFAGIAVGPLLSGKLIEATGSVLSIFYITLGCHVFFILAVGVVVPEPLSKRRQMIARKKHKSEELMRNHDSSSLRTLIHSVWTLFAPLKILYPTGPGSSRLVRRNLVLLASIDTLVFGVAMGALSVITVYLRKEFGWGIKDQSIFVSTVNVCRVACLFLVLPAINRFFRPKDSDGGAKHQARGCDRFDLNIIKFSILLDMIGYVGFTLARTGVLFTLAGSITAIGGMASPTLSSSLTKHVPHDRTGQLLGAAGLLHALARVVAPAVFNALFFVSVGKFNQLLWLVLTLIFVVAFAMSFALRKGVFLEDGEVPLPRESGEREDAADEGEVGRS